MLYKRPYIPSHALVIRWKFAVYCALIEGGNCIIEQIYVSWTYSQNSCILSLLNGSN